MTVTPAPDQPVPAREDPPPGPDVVPTPVIPEPDPTHSPVVPPADPGAPDTAPEPE